MTDTTPTKSTPQRKGRGAVSNQDDRYRAYTHEDIDDGWGSLDAPLDELKTTVKRENARTIISRNQSPDVPFEQSINPYRGCEHGCIYCYARPSHAYLGLSPGLDFESRLYYKPNAADLLHQELCAPNYRCRVLALGANTDPYQPIEKRYQVSRIILEMLVEAKHPVMITTKSSLVERDIELLQQAARDGLVVVNMSITTLDHDLARKLEPRCAAPLRRIETIRRLSRAGIPVHLILAPVIPVLTESHLERVLEAAAGAGAFSASYVMLRLPLELKSLFREWLAEHYPQRAHHVMSIVKQMRQGKDSDHRFGWRRRGTGVFAELIAARFRIARERYGLGATPVALDVTKFSPPHGQQTLSFE